MKTSLVKLTDAIFNALVDMGVDVSPIAMFGGKEANTAFMNRVEKALESSQVDDLYEKTGTPPKPDFLDLDGDGDTKEPMKQAAKDKKDKEVTEHHNDPDFPTSLHNTTVYGFLDDLKNKSNDAYEEVEAIIKRVYGKRREDHPDDQVNEMIQPLIKMIQQGIRAAGVSKAHTPQEEELPDDYNVNTGKFSKPRRVDEASDFSDGPVTDKELMKIFGLKNQEELDAFNADCDAFSDMSLPTATDIYNVKKQFKKDVEDAKAKMGRVTKEVLQDKDIKSRKGTQPAKYHKGLSKSTKAKRDQQFKDQAKKADNDPSAYKPAPGDKGSKTKPSKHTNKFKQMFGEDLQEVYNMGLEEAKKGKSGGGSRVDKALRNKAKKTKMPLGILRQVYNRGVAAWKSGHRPGAGKEQWGLARVNSFTTGGKTTKVNDGALYKRAKAAQKKSKAKARKSKKK